MTYHVDNLPKEIEKPLKSANMTEVVPKWDADFVDVDQELLFELILVCHTTPPPHHEISPHSPHRAVLLLCVCVVQAANYMDIKPLLDLTCAKVASMIKGRPSTLDPRPSLDRHARQPALAVTRI